MGRSPCCEKVGLKKGSWTPEEDQKLMSYIQEHSHGSWRALPLKAGLQRCGKSCRLRWTNYLRPDIKRGKFSLQEEQTIIQLHALLGNRWSAIATHLPKRTDNEIKNYWNTHLKKKLTKMGIDPVTHKPKSYALGSAETGQSKDAANLSHMAQWESARLEAEARFVREYKHRPPHHRHLLPVNVNHYSLLDAAVNSQWSSQVSGDHYPYNSSSSSSDQNVLLPSALPTLTQRLEIMISDSSAAEAAGNDWNLFVQGVVLSSKDDNHSSNAPPPFPPDMHHSVSTEESTWIPQDTIDFSRHLLPHNSSLSLAEDSDNANGNCTAPAFEENNHYWNNIISLLEQPLLEQYDSSTANYSLENVLQLNPCI